MRLLNDELAKNILEASKKEFLEKGFQKASVRSIAAAVNVTTGAVYRYYENKEALFDALVKAPSEELYEFYLSYNEDFSNQELNEQMDALSNGIEDDDGRQHGIADLRNIGSVGRRDAFVQLLDILESDLEREALRRDTTVEQCLEHERIVGAGRNTEAQPVSHRRRPKAVFS